MFQVIPDAFKYGYLAFNEATLHNHSGLSGPTFRIESTILSNGNVGIPDNITIDGSVIASGQVTLAIGSTLTGDIFANAVSNSGTIEGRVALLTSVADLPASAGTWDRLDADGNKYAWYNGHRARSLSGIGVGCDPQNAVAHSVAALWRGGGNCRCGHLPACADVGLYDRRGNPGRRRPAQWRRKFRLRKPAAPEHAGVERISSR